MNGGRYNNKKELGGVGGKARPEKGRGRSKGSRREQQTGVVRGERGVRYNRRRTLKNNLSEDRGEGRSGDTQRFRQREVKADIYTETGEDRYLDRDR